jgi:hypothetical protein
VNEYEKASFPEDILKQFTLINHEKFDSFLFDIFFSFLDEDKTLEMMIESCEDKDMMIESFLGLFRSKSTQNYSHNLHSFCAKMNQNGNITLICWLNKLEFLISLFFTENLIDFSSISLILGAFQKFTMMIDS